MDDIKARLLAALRENQSTSLAAVIPQRVGTAPSRGRRPVRPMCSSGKVCFLDEASARRRLNAILDTAADAALYVPTKVRGPCRKCGYFHLTSKESKQWKHGKRSRFNDIR